MITLRAYKHEGVYTGFHCSGHAGFDDEGKDIVCAGVTVAIQLTINGIIEVIKQNAKVEVSENVIAFSLTETSESATAFMDAFMLQMQSLEEDYPDHIQITNLEV